MGNTSSQVTEHITPRRDHDAGTTYAEGSTPVDNTQQHHDSATQRIPETPGFNSMDPIIFSQASHVIHDEKESRIREGIEQVDDHRSEQDELKRKRTPQEEGRHGLVEFTTEELANSKVQGQEVERPRKKAKHYGRSQRRPLHVDSRADGAVQILSPALTKEGHIQHMPTRQVNGDLAAHQAEEAPTSSVALPQQSRPRKTHRRVVIAETPGQMTAGIAMQDVGDVPDSMTQSHSPSRATLIVPPRSSPPIPTMIENIDPLRSTNAVRNGLENEKASTNVGARPLESSARATGAFTAQEREIADGVFWHILRAHDMTDLQLRLAIKDWRSEAATPFKQMVEGALPRRDKPAIRKFSQRAYSIDSKKGAWTSEEDDQLRRGFEVHPGQWTKIADYVGRRAEDCRDRWRNAVSLQQVSRGAWSVDEEDKLRQLVKECIMKMNKAGRLSELVKHVDWNVVSKGMDQTRSAKYCREKFQKLQQRSESYRLQKRRPQMTPSARLWNQAETQLEGCGLGDIYDALAEIMYAVPKLDTRFADATTFWSVVAMHNQHSKFSSVLRRRLFDLATKDYRYGYDSAVELAEAAQTMSAAMQELHGMGELARTRTYVPPKQRVGTAETADNPGDNADEESDSGSFQSAQDLFVDDD